MTAQLSAASLFESTEPVSAVRSPPRARVLVIDDELAICRSLQRLLSKDHDVTIECDPRVGAEMAASGAWDIIFCDLMMPVMTGMDVYESLMASTPEVARRVIFMTAGSFSPRSLEFLESTENVHLTKPFESAKLRCLVQEFVPASRGR
jgi:CheY-like chemotaxis protein